MRKLVTLRKIVSVTPIKDADMIEEVSVGGWSVVAQKGIHTVGDSVLYYEIDSFLPASDDRYESFMKFGTQTFNGVLGHRVKTKRLRGVYSQGIILPVGLFPELTNPEEDVDYSGCLGVVKYERQEVVGYSGDAKGSFPWFLRKSDQERIQNLYGKLQGNDELFVGTLKMDGSSITCYYVNEQYSVSGLAGGFGLCSRNQELKLDPFVKLEDQGKFVQGAVNSDVLNKAKQLHDIFGGYYAIQGELVGAGIQGTFEKFEEYEVFAYNIFDIVAQEFVSYSKFVEMAEAIQLQCVPVIFDAQTILTKPLAEILEMAEGKGLRAKYREGIVWKQVDGNLQFKAISNSYLNKEQ